MNKTEKVILELAYPSQRDASMARYPFQVV